MDIFILLVSVLTAHFDLVTPLLIFSTWYTPVGESDATVTIVHSRTKDAKAECLTADIVIAAVGRPEMVTSDWIKPGAVVVDVGINRIDDSTRE